MAKKRLGIYGGTFSPPHKGHIEAAEAFMREMKLDELLIIPTFLPPHKEAGDGATPTDRLNMCRIAFSHIPNTYISDMEIKRGGKSYTYLTLEELSHPDTDIFFLVGTDMILTFDLWKRYEYIFSLATICYARRESDSENDVKIDEKVGQYEKLGAKIVKINHKVHEISSTDVRSLADARELSLYVTRDVCEYIFAHSLYGTSGGAEKELSEKVKELMSERRFTHTLGVVAAAEKIALAVCPSLTSKARICALLHDVTKEMKQWELVGRYSLSLSNDDRLSPETLHALTACSYIKEHFPKFADSEILSAIRTHTTGSPNMGLLNKILFVADFIEENRRYEASKEIREELYLTFARGNSQDSRHALDLAVVSSIDRTLSHLKAYGKPVHTLTHKTRESLINSIEKQSRGN